MGDEAQLARRVVDLLFSRDVAARSLGVQIAGVRRGYTRLTMRVRPDMVNGHALCHGGLIFTLADTAFAFACNSHNDNALAAAANIEFLAPAHVGDELTAEATERWRGQRSGVYDVDVTNQAGTRIAVFRGRAAKVHGTVIDTGEEAASHGKP
jgi:acyl-CoA thioesterase